MQARLATGFGAGPDHGDAMSAQSRCQSGFQAGDAGAHDDYMLLFSCHRQMPVQFIDAAGARVVVAGERQVGDDGVPASVARDAITDVARASRLRLGRPSSVGDQGASQADQLGFAVGQQAFGFCRVGDAAERHHGNARRRRAQQLGQLTIRDARMTAVRHMHFECVVVRALGVAEVVRRQRCRDLARDGGSFTRRDAVRDAVIARQLDAEDEATATGMANRGGQFDQESRASGPITTVIIVAAIRARRQKLVNQVAMPG